MEHHLRTFTQEPVIDKLRLFYLLNPGFTRQFDKELYPEVVREQWGIWNQHVV